MLGTSDTWLTSHLSQWTSILYCRLSNFWWCSVRIDFTPSCLSSTNVFHFKSQSKDSKVVPWRFLLILEFEVMHMNLIFFKINVKISNYFPREREFELKSTIFSSLWLLSGWPVKKAWSRCRMNLTTYTIVYIILKYLKL